jgi:GNAT superfamily N-acetyltransferase
MLSTPSHSVKCEQATQVLLTLYQELLCQIHTINITSMKVQPLQHNHIIRTSLWSRPDVISVILNPWSKLDPTVLFSRTELFLLYNHNCLCSFACIKHYSSSVKEIKSVYTYPKFRNKGHARKLLSHLRRRYQHAYLVCRAPLVSYYNKNGFTKTSKQPREIFSRVSLWNSLFGAYPSLRALILRGS